MRVWVNCLVIAAFMPPSFAWAIPAEGHKIMISAPSPYAVEVGRKVHAAGGNACTIR